MERIFEILGYILGPMEDPCRNDRHDSFEQGALRLELLDENFPLGKT